MAPGGHSKQSLAGSPSGHGTQTKVHYRGKEDDFIVFAENIDAVKQWKNDKTIPLAQVVNGWKVFVTHKHGAQGVLDGASKASLENEFGTSKDEDVVAQILEKGDVQETTEPGRVGNKNMTNGSFVAHA